MIDDTERREAARRLRELHLGGGSKDLIERTLSDAIGAWRESGMSWDFITERLADLIEPSEPEGTCGNCKHFIKDRFMPCAAAHGYTEADVSACEDFSPLSCDREALLALADELCDGYPYGLSHGGLEQLARRIREALGVSDG